MEYRLIVLFKINFECKSMILILKIALQIHPKQQNGSNIP